MARTVSTLLSWIANKAREPNYQYGSLAHQITPELLAESFSRLNKKAASGIDKQTAQEYEEHLGGNLNKLHKRLVAQEYKAPPVRRVMIPKNDKETRPLGLPTVEDKVVQGAVKMLLEPIYEEEFYEYSYGYRPKKNAHQALSELWGKIMNLRGVWLIDADISDYFGSIDHKHMREFLKRRITDGSLLRLIGKWLKAGVLEEGKYRNTVQGTPQGGVISPLLANIYLHYALDEWFAKEVQPRMKGRVFMMRYADDYIIGCELEEDARRVMEVLPKRMSRYGLTIHPEKTKLLDFTRPLLREKKGKSSFDFLGFRHYWAKSRKGIWVVKRKTSPKKQRGSMKRISQWCKANRHQPVSEQHRMLCWKLKGYYNYYGITSNMSALAALQTWTRQQWYKWLNRRGGKRISWKKFRERILMTYPLPPPRIIHSVMK